MNVYYYIPPTVNSSFKNPTDNPSFRLRCWQIHQNLIKEGYSSKIVESTKDIKAPDIVILMSFGEEELSLAKWLKKKNKHVIHDYSEDIRDIPVLEDTKKLCDYLVCCSTALALEEAKVYKDKVVTIKDPVEYTPIMHNPNHENSPLRVVWCGMGGNADLIDEFLLPIIQKQEMEYIEISNRPQSTLQWDPISWYYYMASCDICICPQAHWLTPAKSNIKVTTAMSLGLPVLASPIISYQELIDFGINGYLCNEVEDWEIYLNKLRSKDLRNEFVQKSFKKLEAYSLENIYGEWKNIFKRCLNE